MISIKLQFTHKSIKRLFTDAIKAKEEYNNNKTPYNYEEWRSFILKYKNSLFGKCFKNFEDTIYSYGNAYKRHNEIQFTKLINYYTTLEKDELKIYDIKKPIFHINAMISKDNYEKLIIDHIKYKLIFEDHKYHNSYGHGFFYIAAADKEKSYWTPYNTNCFYIENEIKINLNEIENFKIELQDNYHILETDKLGCYQKLYITTNN